MKDNGTDRNVLQDSQQRFASNCINTSGTYMKAVFTLCSKASLAGWVCTDNYQQTEKFTTINNIDGMKNLTFWEGFYIFRST